MPLKMVGTVLCPSNTTPFTIKTGGSEFSATTAAPIASSNIAPRRPRRSSSRIPSATHAKADTRPTAETRAARRRSKPVWASHILPYAFIK